MSRVGKRPIPIPSGVQVTVEGQTVRVKGPKGELEHTLPQEVSAVVEGGQLRVARRDEERRSRALHGLSRSLLANMVLGVSQGFEKGLEIHGTGYRASKSGRKVVLHVGFSHPVEFEPPPGVEVEVTSPTTLLVKGCDKQLVGQVAADLRAVRKPEPYLGKGIRLAGERVRRKAGKAGKAGKR